MKQEKRSKKGCSMAASNKAEGINRVHPAGSRSSAKPARSSSQYGSFFVISVLAQCLVGTFCTFVQVILMILWAYKDSKSALEEVWRLILIAQQQIYKIQREKIGFGSI